MTSATDRHTADSPATSEERLRLLIESVSDYAIFMLDPEGRVSSWNRGAERIKGYKADEIIGRHFSQFYPQDAIDRGWPEYELRMASETGRFEDEAWRVRKDGSRFWANVIISAMRDANGRLIGFSKVTRDLTERKQAEEALRLARDGLERRVEERTAELSRVNQTLLAEVAERQRLEVELRALVAALQESDRNKNLFLATLAHELRNPLAPIRTAAELMRLKAPRDRSLGRSLDIIDRQVRQMVRLIDDLLDLSRITRNMLELKKERISLRDVVRQAIETSRPLIEGRDQTLSVNVPDEVPAIEVDPARLAQVLANLLNNASKFTPTGGRIELAAAMNGSHVKIAVRDNGIGIRREDLGHIFEMFAQGNHAPDEAAAGLGIGLTLSKRLVEMHGGTIAVSSEGPGTGAEFTVALPVAGASPPPPNPAPSRDNPSSDELPRRILIADDNRDAVESLAMYLKLLGSDIRTARDGLTALELAEAFKPDIALIDLGMPQLDGFETARRIRAQPWGRSMRLVALTGWGHDEYRTRSREAGFDDHLVKPVDPLKLRALLRSHPDG